MHLHLLNSLSFLAFATIPCTIAQEVSNSTVPEECKTICNPVVELTSKCNIPTNRADIESNMHMPMKKRSDMEDVAEAECICNNTSFDVKSVMGLCASCMGQNAGTGNKTAVEGMEFFSNFIFSRDMDKIMNECKFPTTSYASSATSLVAGVQVQATQPAITVTAGTGATGKLEVATCFWGVGMLLVSGGLGAGLFMGML